jgi:DNA-binding Lrp family transcriptional regulator
MGMVLKDVERKMLSELVKNSRRSDRELAKAIGTSQPTATRVRTKLEKEGYVREYTAVPDLSRIGYTILALNFLKLDLKLSQDELREFKKTHYDAIAKSPNPVFLVKSGMGLGYDAVILSLHENYSACDQFRSVIRDSMSANIIDMNTFLVNLEEERTSLPFTFSLLANQILRLAAEEKK